MGLRKMSTFRECDQPTVEVHANGDCIMLTQRLNPLGEPAVITLSHEDARELISQLESQARESRYEQVG